MKAVKLRIVLEDPEFVVVEKPAGVHVHPPEDASIRIPRHENGMAVLRDQLGKKVFPVHRLDRATSGLVIYALSSEAASRLAGQFAAREVEKSYVAIARGWPSVDRWVIDSPMQNSLDEPGPDLPAETEVEVVRRVSLPQPIGKYPETRFALCWVKPRTGRTHQIRRHLRRETHPLLGDSKHGDADYNAWIRSIFGRNVLFLKAYELGFRHPSSGEPVTVRSSWGESWHRMFELSGVCPWKGA